MTFLLTTVVAGSTWAQQFTARGLDVEGGRQAACVKEVERLRLLELELRDLLLALQGCNEIEQAYDGSGCTPLAGLEHEWLPNAINPAELVFRNQGEIVATYSVSVGEAGASVTTCPAGYTEDD